MIEDIFAIILSSAEGAFLQVGVFVGAVLLLFGYINYKKQGEFVRSIERSKKFQPILGAFLGLTPGCGGAIFVMPLFIKGSVSFGTVVSTLIATMGDSAFVLIATLPKQYLWVSVFSFVVAIITGYVVDYLNIGQILLKQHKTKSKEELNEMHEHVEHMLTEYECSLETNGSTKERGKHIGHEEGDEIDLALHHQGEHDPNSFRYQFTHHYAYKVFWLITTLGLVLGILLLFQVDINTDLGLTNIGTIIGIGGTLFSILYMIIDKKFIRDDSHEEAESKIFSLKETLIHNAGETAFVNTWVFVAYVLYEVAVYLLGGEAVVESWMLASGLISVMIGALIGLIPGCGPQIIFVTLFTKGWIPFAALLANAISQDGDALFPLIIMDKKSSLWATIITTIPAIVVGILYYFIEIRF